MPSLRFPDTGTRYVELSNGRPAINQVGYLYADEALTVVAEAYVDVSGVKGALLPTDVDGRRYITLDAYGRQPDYWGPNSSQDRLWILINGVKSRVDADYNARIDTVEARVVTLEAGSGSSAGLTAHVNGTTGVHGIADTALLETTTGAQGKADAAQSAAVSTAAADATVKADAALSAAVVAAAADSTMKANNAQSAATSAAATDATSKVAAEATARVDADALLTPRSRAITAGTGLTGGGDMTADRTLAVSYGTSAGTAAQGNDSRITGAAQKASNLSDLANTATARTNLGLGSVDNTSDASKPVSTATATALASKVAKDSLVVNVEDYAVGNANFLHTDGKWYTDSSHTTLATDDTAAIRALVTAGAKNLWFGSCQYRVKWTQQTTFLGWASANGVTIRGNSAALCDETVYTPNPVNPYTPVFEFDACRNVSVSGVRYIGPEIAIPATNHGYVGATYVRCKNATEDVTVDASITNARYGVQSGSFPTAADGYNKKFRLRLDCAFVGYPMAHYLAEDVQADIYATDVHRASYLAGVKGVRQRVKFKNQWIANVVCLHTDSLTGSGTSRGCTDVRTEVTDLGSDRTELTCIMAGIVLQRCDPETTFSDIHFSVHSKSTDTVSQNVTAFQIFSGVSTLYPATYPLNWIPSIYIRNFSVSGLVDKSLQTVPHATGNFYVQTNHGTSYATVSNFRADGLTIIPSSGEASFDYLYIQGLIDRATIANCSMNNYNFTIIGNLTYPVLITNSTLGNLTSQTKTLFEGSSRIRSLSESSWTNATAINTEFGGAACRIRSKQTELTLTGPSVSWASAIPASVIVLGVSGVITQTITGATGMQIGVSGDLSRYLNTNSTAAGTQFTPANQAVTETNPRWSSVASTSIVATAKTTDFTGGKVKIFLSFIDFTAPSA
jgi:hypothetical protein